MTQEEIKDVYERVYALTSQVTVTTFDCGTLCQKRCCETFAHPSALPENEAYGMELYPGEELILAEELSSSQWLAYRFLSGKEYHLPTSWGEEDGVYFIGCSQPCPRDRRPLRCRFFPYKPVLKPSGKIALEFEKGAPNYCPLTEAQLDPAARKKLEEAIELLATIPKVRELLWWDAQP